MTSNNDAVEFVGQRLSVFIGKLEEFLRKTRAHGGSNHDARSSVATFSEISVNLHAPLANFNGAQPIRPSYIPLRGREFDYNSENAYRLIESKLKQLANYSRIEFSVSWLDLDSNLRIRVAQNERICATKWENICDYLRFCLWESLGDPNPKEVEEKELVASIYWWLFNEISGERIIRFESFMNSLFHLGYMILIELNKVIK